MAASLSESEVCNKICVECKKEILKGEWKKSCAVCNETVHKKKCFPAIKENCPKPSVPKSPLPEECEFPKTLCTVIQKAGNKLIHLNIGGMKTVETKINHIEEILTFHKDINKKPVVLALTETHVNNSENYGIADYEIQILSPQRKNKISGGIIMYIRDDFEITEVTFDIPLKSELIDCLAVRIKPEESNVPDSFETIFCVFYVNPDIYKDGNQNFLDYFEEVCKILKGEHYQQYRVIIMGDFNIDLLKLIDSIKEDHQALLTKYKILQLIRCPTREQCRKTGLTRTIIDHIYMFEDKYEEDAKNYILESGPARTHKQVSDHNATYITYNRK